MKNLDLKARGIEVMSKQEMKKLGGGWSWWWSIVKAIANNYEDIAEAHGQVVAEGGTTTNNCMGSK